TPSYEAGWVARQLAAVTGARLVMGSATPSVSTYHQAANHETGMAKLTRRVRGNDAEVELVDMRDEAAEGNRQPLSRRLVEVVTRTLEREEQTIIYLNRRGMATFVMCRDCGRSVQYIWPSMALVPHADVDALVRNCCGTS